MAALAAGALLLRSAAKAAAATAVGSSGGNGCCSCGWAQRSAGLRVRVHRRASVLSGQPSGEGGAPGSSRLCGFPASASRPLSPPSGASSAAAGTGDRPAAGATLPRRLPLLAVTPCDAAGSHAVRRRSACPTVRVEAEVEQAAPGSAQRCPMVLLSPPPSPATLACVPPRNCCCCCPSSSESGSWPVPPPSCKGSSNSRSKSRPLDKLGCVSTCSSPFPWPQ